MGLLFLTNTFRSWTSTGSAIHDSEAIVIVRPDIFPANETTPETITFPVTRNIDGPNCCSWEHIIHNNTRASRWNVQSIVNYNLQNRSPWSSVTDWQNAITSQRKLHGRRTADNQFDFNRYHHRIVQLQDTCLENTIPRVSAVRVTKY